MRPRLETLPRKKGIGWAPSTPPRKLPWPMTEPPAPCEAHVLAPTSCTQTCHLPLLSPLLSLLMKPNKTSRPSLSLPLPHPNPNPFQVWIHAVFRQCQILETTSSGLLLPALVIKNPPLTTMVLLYPTTIQPIIITLSSLLSPLTFLDTLAQI